MSKGRILIADDDPAIRSLLKLLVDRAGFEVDMASDGQEALEKLRSHEYLVLLLDLMMPRVNGFEVAKALAEMPYRPAVVVITAFHDVKPREFDGRVVHAIVQKPFDIEVLGSLITNLAHDMVTSRRSEGGEIVDFPARS